ncbi:hypothetical protein GCM10015535_55790 [Streptomyces gelaticus]|uniref:Uncharacterized protein n=1 Tax=Streptomyces gelaticus TaxID=285446 RepID=A0ABQ2W7J5_9ACTN|nr:hypothetical protein [Streptomyces gelaticus]GGV93194.1 hypothetical protein GCM10015535_55790 [Streptomyces gelaticus]
MCTSLAHANAVIEVVWGPEVPDGQQGLHSFDVDSAPAQELLGRFRAAAEKPA